MLGPIVRCALCTALAASAVLGVLPREAAAQSAADKANARQLATEGIKLYTAGKYPEALDMLQRAQSMYDAPVHLLYLARTHAKLGSLVDSAETYRRLQRVQLEPGAPKAFKEAVASADKELAEVEPRVPALRIEVEPAGVQGLEVRIDGEPVPAAAVGIDRPVNPGERKVTVWAPGYSKAEAAITLGEAERKKVALKLVPGEEPPPAGTAAAPPGAGVAADPGVIGVGEPVSPPSKIGFMVGLRLGGAIPSGSAYINTAGEEAGINEDFQTGFGGELHGGVRFLKYFTGVLFVEAYSLRPGAALDELDPATPPGVAVEVTNVTTTSGGGIGVLIGTERGRFGGFGELGVLPVHNFDISRDIQAASVRCTASVTLKGAAVRIGGGLAIPVASFLNLTPYIMATFGQTTSSTSEHDCPAGTPEVDAFIAQHEVDEDNSASHQLFVLGVGGDFLIGRDQGAAGASSGNTGRAVTTF